MTSGTFNFWIDRDKSPGAFETGMRCRWADFKMDGELCTICSDGASLTATLRMGSETKQRLFHIPFFVGPEKRHLVTVSWSKGFIRAFLNSKKIAESPLTT